jgi:hypothetical protein
MGEEAEHGYEPKRMQLLFRAKQTEKSAEGYLRHPG